MAKALATVFSEATRAKMSRAASARTASKGQLDALLIQARKPKSEATKAKMRAAAQAREARKRLQP